MQNLRTVLKNVRNVASSCLQLSRYGSFILATTLSCNVLISRNRKKFIMRREKGEQCRIRPRRRSVTSTITYDVRQRCNVTCERESHLETVSLRSFADEREWVQHHAHEKKNILETWKIQMHALYSLDTYFKQLYVKLFHFFFSSRRFININDLRRGRSRNFLKIQWTSNPLSTGLDLACVATIIECRNNNWK